MWALVFDKSRESMNSTEEKAKQRWRGRIKAFGWIIGGTTIGLCALVTPFILPALRKHCLPYVPATTQQVRLIVENAKGKTLVDIGSGDGRVVSYNLVETMVTLCILKVIEAAKAGYNAVGYELNPWLVVYSKLNSWFHGVDHKTSFHCKDIWKASKDLIQSRATCRDYAGD